MTVRCQGVVKLVSKGNLLLLCYIMFLFFVFMFNCSYGRMTENAFDPLPLPSGVPMPMCFYDDLCKVAKSDEDDTYRQRYWMCANFMFEPTLCQRRINKTVRN